MLDEFRKEIEAIDQELSALIEKRHAISAEIGRYKKANGIPIRNREVEAEVLARGIPFAIIESSCKVQEEAPAPAKDKKVHIIGGEGKMGRWLSHYFTREGYSLSGEEEADIVVLSTPMEETAPIIDRLRDHPGLIFDICSMKKPIEEALFRAVRKGLRITSIHPMFGPNIDTLFDKKILFCSLGNGVEEEAMALFRASEADLISIPFALHDLYFANTTGLTYLSHVKFAIALERSGFSLEELEKIGSVSFGRQIALTKHFLQGDKNLYDTILRYCPEIKERE